MKPTLLWIAALLAIASLSVAWTDETVPAAPPSPRRPAPTVDQARRQAELLHDTLCSTLQTVHHRYYLLDEGLPLPAAVLKEVFADLEKKNQIQLRWLAVEGQVMNTDHIPQDDFETRGGQCSPRSSTRLRTNDQ